MEFQEWWIAEVGHPPADEDDRKMFGFALTTWRAALAFGGDSIIEPEKIEKCLDRVGNGTSTAEDEVEIRMRIRAADDAAAFLGDSLSAYQEAEAAVRPEDPMPAGAQPMGGRMWRCPRCNFICGVKRIERVCRGCSFPGDDTRDYGDHAGGGEPSDSGEG